MDFDYGKSMKEGVNESDYESDDTSVSENTRERKNRHSSEYQRRLKLKRKAEAKKVYEKLLPHIPGDAFVSLFFAMRPLTCTPRHLTLRVVWRS